MALGTLSIVWEKLDGYEKWMLAFSIKNMLGAPDLSIGLRQAIVKHSSVLLYGTCNLIVQKINEATLLWRGMFFSVNQTPSIRKAPLHSYSAIKCLGVRRQNIDLFVQFAIFSNFVQKKYSDNIFLLILHYSSFF